MQPRKLKVGLAFFNYGSNGGIAAEHPDIRKWAVKAVLAAKKDERIEDIYSNDFCDTPITMTRCAAVEWAKQGQLDVLVMIDSDQAPDLYPEGKPFFESSFDFLYQHWDKGPVAVVAPYCGPPSHPTQGGGEIVYVFRWANQDSQSASPQFKQSRYEREEAGYQSGIQEVSSGPTGLCMIDMRCFEFLTPPYFYYEYRGDGVNCPHCNQPQPMIRAEKSSTEDCVFFRDLSLNGILSHGYNPVFCNWDSWAGHWKPKCVGKPECIKADQVASTLKNVVERGQRSGMTRTVIRRPANLPVHPKDARGGDYNRIFAVGEATSDEHLRAVKEACRPKYGHACASPGCEQEIAPANTHCLLHRESNHGPNGHPQHDTFEDMMVGRTIEPPNADYRYRIGEKGVNPDGKPYEIVHPGDPRLDAVPVTTTNGEPDAFKEAHNTNGEDLELLRRSVAQKAYDANVEGRTLKIVELGSWVGHSAVAMAEIASQICDFEIWCVDHFQGGNALQKKVAREHDVPAEFVKNTAKYPQIKFWQMGTDEAARTWRTCDAGEIDLLFIDADHSYEGCKQDIREWWPFLRHTGTMCGHDFNHLFPGVRQAVVECFGWGVTVAENMWFVKKGLDLPLWETKSLVTAIEERHERTKDFASEAQWLGEPSVFQTSDTRSFEGAP